MNTFLNCSYQYWRQKLNKKQKTSRSLEQIWTYSVWDFDRLERTLRFSVTVRLNQNVEQKRYKGRKSREKRKSYEERKKKVKGRYFFFLSFYEGRLQLYLCWDLIKYYCLHLTRIIYAYILKNILHTFRHFI